MNQTKKPRPADKDRTGLGQRRETQTNHFKSDNMAIQKNSQQYVPPIDSPRIISAELLTILAEIESVERVMYMLRKRGFETDLYQEVLDRLIQKMRDIYNSAIVDKGDA